MERLAVHLWWILNRYIGGEEQVYIRRRKTYYLEKLINYLNPVIGIKVEMVYSGSRGEGFNLADSDFDFMYIPNDVTVLPARSVLTQTSDILMETDNIKPGFARLRLSSYRVLSLFPHDIAVKWNDGQYVSSLLYRDCLVKAKGGNSYGHGPCSTSIDPICGYEADMLFCFQCKVWSLVASEWVHRHRPQNWPSRELVNEIIEDGCLLVPVGDPLSDTSFMEWRMSFSLAERKLVHSFNHTQFLCYGLLKLFLKHIVNSNDTTKDLLCSYFMKTIVFYVIEEEPLIWDKQNFFTCFWTCFKRLLFCVREGSCPNYFVKYNNMFENKISGVNKEVLLHFLSSLYCEHFEILAKIPVFTELFINLHFNPILLNVSTPAQSHKEIELRRFLEVIETSGMIATSSLRETDILLDTIHTDFIRSTTNIHDTDLLIAFAYNLNCQYAQYLYQIYVNRYRILSNKSRYRYLTLLKYHIIHKCIGGDICSGWLQYATLCYLTGQYRRVIGAMDFVLSKFKPYTIVAGMPKQSNIECFMETICGNNLSVSQKRRMAVAMTVSVKPECEFYPFEIKQEIVSHVHGEATRIIPLVYVYILKCLSCCRLGFRELGTGTLDTLNDLLCNEEFGTILLPLCIDLAYKCSSYTC